MNDMDQFLKLIEYVGAAIGAAVGVLLWVHSTFQTKQEAKRELEVADDRFKLISGDLSKMEVQFNSKIDDVKSEISGVHDDMKGLRHEMRSELSQIRTDLHGIRQEYGGIAKDLSYIKGRLEPKT